MSEKFRIEFGVEFPPPRKSRQRESRPRRRWPFSAMQVGDSFVVPGALRQALREAASTHGRRHGAKFATRKQADGTYRCWRIA